RCRHAWPACSTGRNATPSSPTTPARSRPSSRNTHGWRLMSDREAVRATRLPGGIQVVTHAMPHLESVSLGVWVDAGARHENPREHGIAHFLEHMAFKGTGRRTALQIAEEIESVGGDLNAATGMEA